MSYTNETTNYGLPLPTGSDKSTFTDNNTAFQAVDAALHTAYEQSGAATEDIVAIKATVANLILADINFQSDLDTEKGKIRNLQDKEVLQDAAIAAVKADAQDMITAYNEPSATSTHVYSAGDFFIYNDVLYRATDSIGIGDTIVPDTNCTTTNVTTEVGEIDSTLSDKQNKAWTLLGTYEGTDPFDIPAGATEMCIRTYHASEGYIGRIFATVEFNKNATTEYIHNLGGYSYSSVGVLANITDLNGHLNLRNFFVGNDNKVSECSTRVWYR